GNDELFSREQLVEWIDASSLTKSAAQWDPKKLNWVNAHYIKHTSDIELARRVAPRIAALGGNPEAVDLPEVMAILKDRAETQNEIAEGALLFWTPCSPADVDGVQQHVAKDARQLLDDFATQPAALSERRVNATDTLINSLRAT